MKTILFFLAGISICSTIYSQNLTVTAGEVPGLSRHQLYEPPVHVERVGPGQPVEYTLDVNLDGKNDIIFTCGNSYAAMGYASNYITVTALDSNSVCCSRVDSSFCINGFQPVYFARLFNAGDTITGQLPFSSHEMVIDTERWFMGDTCSMWIENTGMKFLGIRLNSSGGNGLAWIRAEWFGKSYNGFSADIIEAGFKSGISMVTEMDHIPVLVYPNPACGFITLHIPGSWENMTARIVDLLGNEVKVVKLNGSISNIGLEQGAYVVHVSDQLHNFRHAKVIVR